MESLSQNDLVCGFPRECPFARAILHIYELLQKALFECAAAECDLTISNIRCWSPESFRSVAAGLRKSLPKNGRDMEELLLAHLPQYAGVGVLPEILSKMAAEFREFVDSQIPQPAQ